MYAEPPNQRMDSLIAAAIVIILVGVCLASVAFAGISLNTIDPVAIVADNGRQIIMTGPIVGTAGETAALRVTVTQRATGEVAQGLMRLTCTGDDQQWEVHAMTDGKQTFEAGPTTAVALGRTTFVVSNGRSCISTVPSRRWRRWSASCALEDGWSRSISTGI